MGYHFDKFKKNKIKILKLIITFSVIYFLICSFMTLLYDYNTHYFMTIVIFYAMYNFILKLV